MHEFRVWKGEGASVDGGGFVQFDSLLTPGLRSNANSASVAFSPSGNVVAGASGDSLVIWNLEGQRQGSDSTRFAYGVFDTPATTSSTTRGIRKIAFDPKGTHIAYAGKGEQFNWQIGLLDLDTKSISVLVQSAMPVVDMTFLPDGSYLVIVHSDRNITPIPYNLPDPLLAHKGAVHSVAFSPDDRRLATGGADGKVYIWDTETRAPIDSLVLSGSKLVPAGDSLLTIVPVLDVAYSPDGSMLAATGVDSTVALWVAGNRRATLAFGFQKWKYLVFGILGVLLFAGLVAWLWQWYRAKRFLERHQSDEDPDLEHIILKEVEQHLFPKIKMFQVAQRMRRREEVPSTDIDVNQTVNASVHKGGVFSPIFGYRKYKPEYLALIDRSSFDDHQFALIEEHLNILRNNEVFVERYHFDGDPRICYPMRHDDKPLALKTLHQRFPGHRLLLFCDAGNLFSRVTGGLERWTETLFNWENRTLLTPEPSEYWNHREAMLADSFLVVHASVAGLASLAEGSKDGSLVYDFSEYTRMPLPRILRWQPKQWIERHPPNEKKVEEMMEFLKLCLDKNGFFWICACAIYPALSWRLTLNLGYELTGEDGVRLLHPGRLAAIARLPWFRYGYMPDWLRLRLLAELTDEQEKYIRSVLDALLFAAIRGDKKTADLEIARLKTANFKGLMAYVRKRLKKEVSETHPLRDYVFLRFMNGKNQNKLTVRVQNALGDLFSGKRGRQLPPARKKEVRWLRNRVLQLGAGSLALIIGLTWLWNAMPVSSVDNVTFMYASNPFRVEKAMLPEGQVNLIPSVFAVFMDHPAYDSLLVQLEREEHLDYGFLEFGDTVILNAALLSGRFENEELPARLYATGRACLTDSEFPVELCSLLNEIVDAIYEELSRQNFRRITSDWPEYTGDPAQLRYFLNQPAYDSLTISLKRAEMNFEGFLEFGDTDILTLTLRDETVLLGEEYLARFYATGAACREDKEWSADQCALLNQVVDFYYEQRGR